MNNKAQAYNNLVNVKAQGLCNDGTRVRVIPNDSANSLLWLKVHWKTDAIAPACGAAMPKAGAALSAAQVDTIKAWINAGALNN